GRDQETGDDGGEQPVLGVDAAGDAEGDGQGQGDQADRHPGAGIRRELVGIVGFQLIQQARPETRQLHCYFTFMPGWAPSSGEMRKMPGPSPEAASTMPWDSPKRILRGARLATMTVRRPTSLAGS